MNNSYKDEVIEKIKYGKKDYNDYVDLNTNENPTPICFPTVVTNKRSYGPFPEKNSPMDVLPCDYSRWEVIVPKNKNFNDWFNSEYFVWSGVGMAPSAIAGFHSEIDMQSTCMTTCMTTCNSD